MKTPPFGKPGVEETVDTRRLKKIEYLREYLQRPEVKEKRKTRSVLERDNTRIRNWKKYHFDPSYRERQKNSVYNRSQSPESKRLKSIKQKEYRSTPEYKDFKRRYDRSWYLRRRIQENKI